MAFAVEQALRRLDDSARDDARAAIESLLPEHGDWSDLLQLSLQGFLWYQLPTKWLTSSSHHHEIARAVGDLFEAGGLDRYAALCRSAETRELIDLRDSDPQEARRRFRTLMTDSGVDPADTPALTWGPIQGMTEYSACLHVSAVLEAAVVDGALVPGRRGWRTVAGTITDRALRGPDPAGTHSSLLASIEDERRGDWLVELRRRTLLPDDVSAALAEQLARPPVDGDLSSVATSLEPLAWFLGQVGEGLTLTERGYLPRRLVLDADERYDWFELKPQFSVRTERDLPELTAIHRLAREARLVTLSRRRLTISARGRAALSDEQPLVRAVLAAIFDPTTWAGDAAVGTAVSLVSSRSVTRPSTDELDVALHRYLRSRWRPRASELTVTDVRGAYRVLLHAGRAFDWFAPEERGVWDRAPALTAIGRSASLLGLAAVARAPRR